MKLNSFFNNVPIGLIYLRLAMGLSLIPLSFTQFSFRDNIIVTIMVLALITDVFDGIIARKLNISTQKLRRLDSSIDQVFWILATFTTVLICPEFLAGNYVEIAIIVFLEGLAYLISFLRFKKEVSTHAILSKIWTLTIVGTLIQVVLTCNSPVIFAVCFYLGIITRLEIIAILFILKNWTNDVPSLYHAILLRQGKEIKRHKLFNG